MLKVAKQLVWSSKWAKNVRIRFYLKNNNIASNDMKLRTANHEQENEEFPKLTYEIAWLWIKAKTSTIFSWSATIRYGFKLAKIVGACLHFVSTTLCECHSSLLTYK
jgi:hypothetical protein